MAKTRTGNPRKAIGYLRISLDRSDLGPEAQRASIEAWAAREGVEVVAWHFDQGVSGGAAIDKRPALLDALAALETEEAGVLAIAKRDRLSRDTMNAIAIEGLVAKAGARIVSAAGEGTDADADDPAAFMLRRMLDVFAEYERLVIKARTRAALRVKRSKGEALGETPYGYARSDRGMLVADAVEQQVIGVIRELHRAGMSLRTIAAELESRGMVSRTGKPLGKTQVARVLAKEATA